MLVFLHLNLSVQNFDGGSRFSMAQRTVTRLDVASFLQLPRFDPLHLCHSELFFTVEIFPRSSSAKTGPYVDGRWFARLTYGPRPVNLRRVISRLVTKGPQARVCTSGPVNKSCPL